LGIPWVSVSLYSGYPASKQAGSSGLGTRVREDSKTFILLKSPDEIHPSPHSPFLNTYTFS
jgi:hypothetical protein